MERDDLNQDHQYSLTANHDEAHGVGHGCGGGTSTCRPAGRRLGSNRSGGSGGEGSGHHQAP